MNELIIVALLAFIAWQDWQRKKERQEFFDYIKAKDIKELKDIREVARPVKSVSTPPDELPIEQVSDEQFDMAIKKELGREPVAEKVKERLKKVIHGR